MSNAWTNNKFFLNEWRRDNTFSQFFLKKIYIHSVEEIISNITLKLYI
jgi:hypothetical protein